PWPGRARARRGSRSRRGAAARPASPRSATRAPALRSAAPRRRARRPRARATAATPAPARDRRRRRTPPPVAARSRSALRSSREGDRGLDLDRHPGRELGDADRAAGAEAALLAVDLDDEVGEAVHHRRLVAEAGRRADETEH